MAATDITTAGGFKERRVVGLGEVLWDLFPDARQPGGATANVAFHAGQLGCTGIVASRVGRDPLGRDLVRYLAEHQIVTSHIQHDDSAPTGTVSVEVYEGGHRFTIHERVAWDRLEFTPHWQTLMQNADAVCFGTLAQRSPMSREAIRRCLYETGEDCLIVFDVNIRQHFYDKVTIERSLQCANIVKLNSDELKLLIELLQFPPCDEAVFATRLRDQFGVDIVCITRGADGCFVNSSTETADLPGELVAVADTVGSGDAFTAALIAARLNGWPLVRSAQFANAAGALVASRPGAMPRLIDEFQQLNAKYRPT